MMRYQEDHVSVRRAALYMDKIKPDWFEHVDPLRLNLDEPCDCVAGQNGYNWDEFEDDAFEAQRPDVVMLLCSRAYEPLWLEEIALRMESARTPSALESVRV